MSLLCTVMFLRNFRVKSNTATKGSDRKKLKRQILSAYPHVQQTLIDKLLPSRVSMATIQLTTHSGASVMVYLVDNEPLFCEDDCGLYPTGTNAISETITVHTYIYI